MLALLLACVVLIVVGLVCCWPLWLVGLLGLLTIVGDITWAIVSFARGKRAGESKLKF